ncbi:hypothetical protein U9M48_019559, partial [Paspalum notatum var. saurae]
MSSSSSEESNQQSAARELVELPQGHRAITLKWVYKLKRDESGNIVKHKARLVARGFVQQANIDYDEVFALVARMESVRLLLALAAQGGLSIHHMDVKSAFLNGNLKEEVYVRQPQGFVVAGKEGHVLRLRKALYGRKQAPRAWNSKLDVTLKKMGFTQSEHEHAMYQRDGGGSVLLVGVYVDDLIIIGSKPAAVEEFKAEMKGEFLMSDLGMLSFYLGIEVCQGNGAITLRQTRYAKQILKSGGTTMEERLKLSKDSTAEQVDSTRYRRIVGSLRYLVHTRLDLAIAVGFISRFMERPTEEHFQAVKKLLRYVAGMLNYGLRYEQRPNCTDHRITAATSSTTGRARAARNCLISWQSIKQKVVALSSCEYEYIAATTAATQAIWMARLLGELLGREPEAVELKVDSKSALALSKNPVFHKRSKHIHIRYHFTRNCLDDGSIKASNVTIENQLADILTKALGRVRFQELCARIGM